MNLLIRNARIIATESKHHNTVKDISIVNGKIEKIGNNLKNISKTKELDIKGLHISAGWVDLNAFFAEPGLEHKETIESGCKAAAAGGFTHVCVMPNTQPVVQTKSLVEYVRKRASDSVVEVHPIGAFTHNNEGKELAELYDMYSGGAVAFSDGLKPSPSAGTVERGLLYIKAFDGLLMLHPEDKSISKNGVMNEGITSTLLGLPALPALAEELSVARELYLLDYTASRLHLLDISLKKSVELIKAAKKKGLRITSSVNAHQLWFKDTAVGDYDTAYKVNPPFRTQEDIQGIINGIEDGTVDTITSQHQPQDEECKKLEFDKADFGIVGLESSYAAANTILGKRVPVEKIVDLFATNARKLLKLPAAVIEEGAAADITLFNPTHEWKFSVDDIQSKSRNTPFAGATFTGKVIGVINKNKLHLN
jgi:dihydroorotase